MTPQKRKEYTGIQSVNESLNQSPPVVLITMRAVGHASLVDGGDCQYYPSGELFRDICENKFTLTEEWQRDWSAQPKRGTKYYAGTARNKRGQDRRQHSVVGYSFTWKPRTRQFKVWAVDNPNDQFQTTLEASTARALTKLIADNLAGAQG